MILAHDELVYLLDSGVIQHGQSFRIRPGDAVGQLVFFRHETVNHDDSYLAKGRYNGQRGVNQTRPNP